MATLTITAQYHENYNTETTNPPHWKPKGGHKFTIKVPESSLMYCPDLVLVCKGLLAEQNSDIEKFEYIDHEVDFGRPTEIHPERFDSIADNINW